MGLKIIDAACGTPVISSKNMQLTQNVNMPSRRQKCESKDRMKESWKFFGQLFDPSNLTSPWKHHQHAQGSVAACRTCKPTRALKGFHELLHPPVALSHQNTPLSILPRFSLQAQGSRNTLKSFDSKDHREKLRTPGCNEDHRK